MAQSGEVMDMIDASVCARSGSTTTSGRIVTFVAHYVTSLALRIMSGVAAPWEQRVFIHTPRTTCSLIYEPP